jgi:hypothetical protein
MFIDVLGLEARDLACTVEAKGEGAETHLAIRDVHGRVRSTNDNVHASADLVLEGTRLVRGSGSLRADALPILVRGAPQGRATGRAVATLSREGETFVVNIELPSLVMQLPQTSGRKVIELGDNPDVSIVQLEKAVSEAAVAPWRLNVQLGKDVSLRRSDVELGVTGSPVIELGEETLVSGALDLAPGGRIPVLGRQFLIDHGRVVFDTGEPDNPRIEVAASWRVPTSDQVVYVEVTGTLKEGKIALRSDPPLPEPEVFALILGGGSPESEVSSTAPSQTGGATGGAMALGGSVAAIGVNQLITNSPVELRVDTAQQSQPRYTAAVRISPNLWFEASEYQQTQNTAGSTATQNVFSGTVDYRFTHRWSLRTEVGTAGGALDLLWQYRY